MYPVCHSRVLMGAWLVSMEASLPHGPHARAEEEEGKVHLAALASQLHHLAPHQPHVAQVEAMLKKWSGAAAKEEQKKKVEEGQHMKLLTVMNEDLDEVGGAPSKWHRAHGHNRWLHLVLAPTPDGKSGVCAHSASLLHLRSPPTPAIA